MSQKLYIEQDGDQFNDLWTACAVIFGVLIGFFLGVIVLFALRKYFPAKYTRVCTDYYSLENVYIQIFLCQNAKFKQMIVSHKLSSDSPHSQTDAAKLAASGLEAPPPVEPAYVVKDDEEEYAGIVPQVRGEREEGEGRQRKR